MEKNLISQTISEYSDEYYDAFYDEFSDNNVENSEDIENENEIDTSTTVYVYDNNDYTNQLTEIYNSVNAVSALLLTLILFEIGKVVFNTLKEFF